MLHPITLSKLRPSMEMYTRDATRSADHAFADERDHAGVEHTTEKCAQRPSSYSTTRHHHRCRTFARYVVSTVDDALRTRTPSRSRARLVTEKGQTVRWPFFVTLVSQTALQMGRAVAAQRVVHGSHRRCRDQRRHAGSKSVRGLQSSAVMKR